MRWRTVAILVVACCLSASAAGNGSDLWRWARFTTESGLPADRVLSVVEVPGGSVWAATDRGLAWYDGYRWTPVGPENGIPNRKPTSLVPDGEGGVLVVAGDHLYQGNETGFREVAAQWNDRTRSIEAAIPFDERDLLIVSEGVLLRCNRNAVEAYEPTCEPGICKVRNLWTTPGGALWADAEEGLYRYAGGLWQLKLPGKFGRLDVAALLEDEDGNGLAYVFFPPEQEGLWVWENGGAPVHRPDEHPDFISSLALGPNGEILAVSEGGGINIRSGDRWEPLPLSRAAGRHALWAGYRPNGDLWVATANGLFLYRASSERWKQWRQDPPTPRNRICEILKAKDGTIWVGTHAGIEIRRPNETVEWIERIGTTKLSCVSALGEDGDGRIWVGSGAGFAGTFVRDGNRWERFWITEESNAPTIHKIRKDRRGRLWFLGLGPLDASRSNREGLGAFVLENGAFTRWGVEEGLPSGRVYAFCEAPDNVFWFGTLSGLARFDGKSWTYWTTRNGLKADKVFTLAADANDRLWFGDQENGLGFIDAKDRPHYLTRADGLINDEVWEVEFDLTGRLWAATQGGLSSYKKGTWSSIGVNAGLSDPKIWPILPGADEIYIGTLGCGTQVLDLSEARQSVAKVFPQEPVLERNRALLRWEAAAFQGDMEPRTVETRYRLDGKPWSAWSTTREVTLEHLSAGTHVFHLQAKSLFGNINKRTPPLVFSIPLPLYLRPAFVIPMTVLALASITMGLLFWIRRSRYVQELQESEQRLRTVVTSCPVVLFTTDRKGMFTLSEGRGLRALNLHPGEVLGKSAIDLYKDHPQIGYNLRRALSGEEVEDTVQVGGLSFQTRYGPVRDRSGQVVGMIGVANDVTVAERALALQFVLLTILRAAHRSGILVDLLATIHRELGKLINTRNFYVALYDQDAGTYSFPYCVDEREENTDFTPEEMRRSLTDYVRRTGEPLMVDEKVRERLRQTEETDLVGEPSCCWLGVPLTTARGVIGVVVVQSYEEKSPYTEKDLELLAFVADNIAWAIESKRAEEELRKAHNQLEERVEQRTVELSEANAELHREIEHREHVEQALRESEERYHLAAKGANDGLWDGRVTDEVWHSPRNDVYWSPRFKELLGYVGNEFPNVLASWLDHLHPDDYDEQMEALRAHIEEGRPYDVEYRLRTKSGEYRWFRARGAASRNEAGEAVRMSGSLTDITQRKIAEEALQKAKEEAEAANLAKTEFLAKISHEIRTPITALLGAAELLRECCAERGETGETVSRVDMILRNGQHLLSLIDELLDISRVEAGRLEVNPVRCSLLEIMADVRAATVALHREKDVDFRIRYLSEVPSVIDTDPTRLKQAVINLISNALKFTKEGHVWVSVRVDPDSEEPRLTIEVEDTGIGIEESGINRIFEEFAQLESQMGLTTKGIGLGLPIARWIAEQLGGSLEVKSVVGSGSTFILRVATGSLEDADWVEAEEAAVIPLFAEPEIQIRQRVRLRGRILLAEDFEDTRTLMADVLTNTGAEVVAVNDGRDAVETASREPFDLILMDIRMPTMDGMAALTELRKRGCLTPIIALTASASQGRRQQIIEAGFEDVWTKPISLDQLIESVSAYLASEEEERRANEEVAPGDSRFGISHEATKRLESVIAEFVRALPARLEHLRGEMRAGDWAGARETLHKLVGAGGTFGYMSLSEEAARLLNLVRSGEIEDHEAELKTLEELTTQATNDLHTTKQQEIAD
ncbi:MAG: PAS domain-containing protein [Phycisphaerales bacterium]|nr:MAG: PAS domain-containing protein [Phycisphaerales bacterium]